MNEAASDSESQSSDSETCPNLSKVKAVAANPVVKVVAIIHYIGLIVVEIV